LVIDDEPAVSVVVERFARPKGFAVHACTTGAEGLAELDALRPDVALVDLRMPGLNGIEVLREIRAVQPDCKVILMTGAATVDTAIESVKNGALDYLTKPLDFSRLGRLFDDVKRGLEEREQLLTADATLARQFEFHGMIGRSPVMQELFDRIRRLAPHVRTVLVTGETGVGKELVAKALHASGQRASRRFLTVNCSAVVETLFESELFGHVRGAFTGATEAKMGMFEHASGGTLFLDEAGELPLSVQAKLLRAVEYGEVQRVGSLETRRADVTVIAATNRDLSEEIHKGRFRQDLFYRLSVIDVRVPPLRERKADIPYLTAAFIREFAERLNRPISGLTTAAERQLHVAPWPGNVRELRNVIERACILAENRILTDRDITAAMTSRPSRHETPTVAAGGEAAAQLSGEADTLLATAQRDQITKVLSEVGGNKAAAAKLLGVSRRALYRWLERLEIET
jgi:DNA-binding NtrC family response regulator